MIVRYHGESDPLFFIDGKDYKVLSIEGGMYRIIDEEGVDPDAGDPPGYLYGPDNFEIVSGSPDEYVDKFADDDDGNRN